MFRSLLFLNIAIFICFSCHTKNGKTVSDEFEIPDSLFETKPLEVSEDAMEDIIENVSSPIEMAALIKNSGTPFSQKFLHTTENVDKLSTSYQRALNLGIYGADLGYLNMYSKNGSVVEYITSIKSIAEDLKVGQFFDFNTLKRLATNNSSLDSLMYISVSSFNAMDRYLRENNRGNISTLIITGVWIEGLYLATQVVKEKPNDKIAERIGEQKIILNDLLIVLRNYKSDSNFEDLIAMIEKIKRAYEPIRISYEIGEPETIEKDGMLMIIQNETSHVEISNETLQNIIGVTAEVRNKIVKL